MDPAQQYSRVRVTVSSIETQLQRLEDGSLIERRDTGDNLREELAQSINRLTSDVSAFERGVNEYCNNCGAASASNARLWQRRLAQLQADAAALRSSVERFMQQTYSRSQAAQERELLLGGGGGPQSIALDAQLAARASLMHSNIMIEETLAVAGAVRSSMREQYTTLKSARRKVLDLTSTLGLSNNLMRVIERRTFADKALVYGGGSLLLMGVVILWWHTRASP